METHFLMDISNGRMLYEVFFVLSFLIIYAILIFEGHKSKFPLLSRVLLSAGSLILFLFLMSQTLPGTKADTPGTKKTIPSVD